jgi:2-polyprenyl-3-methyl-5-hydroxy-6-metoxy-1,4-benzoquinol methylase
MVHRLSSPTGLLNHYSLVDEEVGIRNMDVSDMASGGGVLANLLSKYYDTNIASIYAMESGIKFGTIHTPEATWIKDNMFNLQGEYDLVFACEIIEHVVSPKKAIDQMLVSVKSGGNLVITVPDGRIDCEPAGTYSKSTDAYTGHINFWCRERFDTYFEGYQPKVFYLEGRGDQRANKLCAIIHRCAGASQ